MDKRQELIERLTHMADTHHAVKDCAAMTEAAAQLTADAARIAELEAEARRFADCYPEGSDARNTFVIFADKIAASEAKP